jgi:tRNA(Ser,Leu) C12 N-acetylase TAN1
MRDWNAIVTARDRRWSKARQTAGRFARVDRTGFFNVLVARADEPRALLGQLEALAQEDPSIAKAIAHVSPAEQSFDFTTPEEFRAKAHQAVLALAPRLGDKTFHMRIHRRGWKGVLTSTDEERSLAEAVIESTQQEGTRAHVSFDDPDAVILIDIVGTRAGVALWSRADRHHHPLLPTC